MRRPCGHKNKPFTQRELELQELLNAEKQSTSKFIYQMGHGGLLPEEKQRYLEKFDNLSQRIKELQSQETAEWFAGLP
jgi:hypothetical protein